MFTTESQVPSVFQVHSSKLTNECLNNHWMNEILLNGPNSPRYKDVVMNIRLSSVVNCIIVLNYMMGFILYSCHLTCSVYSSKNFLLSYIKAGYAIESKQKWHHCQEEILRLYIVFYHYSFLWAMRMTCLRESCFFSLNSRMNTCGAVHQLTQLTYNVNKHKPLFL